MLGYTPPLGRYTPQAGTHPASTPLGSAHTTPDGHCSGQYASYWNAFLLLLPTTKLGQGYIFTGICDSVHRGGVCLSACWDTTPPGPGTPLGAGTPPRTRHNPWTRHPPEAGTPPGAEHAGRCGQRAGGTHPTGMLSCYSCYYHKKSL